MGKEVSDAGIEAAEHALKLLWGVRKQPGRGPKRGLSVERIVTAAIEVADEEGLEALSMRRVATEIGVGVMSLYTYVPGKAELTELMMDAVLGEMKRPDSAAGGWRAKLALYARESWRLSHRHPWTLQLPLSRGLLGPNQTAMLDSALHAVSGLGLTENEMVSLFFVVVGYVQGAARTALDQAHTEQATGVTDEQWWSTYGRLMSEYMGDARCYPTLTSLSSSAWTFNDPEAEFEFGLQRVLDGIEAFIRERTAQPG